MPQITEVEHNEGHSATAQMTMACYRRVVTGGGWGQFDDGDNFRRK